MSDSHGEGSDSSPENPLSPGSSDVPPPPPARPPKYAGDAGAPPHGFAGSAGSGQSYAPPGSYSLPPRPSSKRSPGRFLVPLVLLLAIGGAAFWFSTRDENESTSGTTVAADSPGAAILTWAQAMAGHDYEAACAAMATAAVEKLTVMGVTCTAELERLSPNGLYDNADTTKVLEEKVEGDRAQVMVKFGGSPLEQQPTAATLEDGTWKADPFSFGEDVEGNEEGDDAASSADDPAEAFLAWTTAVGTGDYAKACALTGSATIKFWKDAGFTCEATLAMPATQRDWAWGEQTEIEGSESAGEDLVDVRAIRFEDGVEKSTLHHRMVREDGVWKYDQIHATG